MKLFFKMIVSGLAVIGAMVVTEVAIDSFADKGVDTVTSKQESYQNKVKYASAKERLNAIRADEATEREPTVNPVIQKRTAGEVLAELRQNDSRANVVTKHTITASNIDEEIKQRKTLKEKYGDYLTKTNKNKPTGITIGELLAKGRNSNASAYTNSESPTTLSDYAKGYTSLSNYNNRQASDYYTTRTNNSADLTIHDYSSNNGGYYTGTSQRIGSFTFTDIKDDKGNVTSTTSSRIGDFNFYDVSRNYSPFGSGSSVDIGDFTFYNFTDKHGNIVTGTETRIGDFSFYDYNDSYLNSFNGSSYNLGNTSYWDLSNSAGWHLSGSSYRLSPNTSTSAGNYDDDWDDF